MINKSDWEEAYRDLLANERERVAPPAAERVQALLSGELGEEEAEAVREQLACYPELAEVMTAAFPEDAPAMLTDEELAADRERLRARLGLTKTAPRPEPIPLPRRRKSPLLAVAAVIVILVGIGSYTAWLTLRLPSEDRILHADGQRGGVTGQTPIQLLTNTRYHLKLVHRPEHAYREYRLELLDLTSGRSVWQRDGVEHSSDNSFPANLSTKGLPTGLYRFVLSGIDDNSVPLASYTCRLTERRRKWSGADSSANSPRVPRRYPVHWLKTPRGQNGARLEVCSSFTQ